MSLIIKGMDMPQSCWRCPLCLTVDPDTYRCMPTGQDFESTFDAIDHIVLSCPLAEIPPHGRLIDADELLEHVGRDKIDSRELIANMIDHAPTIIEAEVKE